MVTLFKSALFATSLFVLVNCSVKKQSSSDKRETLLLPFVEFVQTNDGKVIRADAPKGRRIDGPSYRFDKEGVKLEILRKTVFSFDTTTLILGNVRILTGSAGSGVSSYIKAVGKLPYTQNKLTILSVDAEALSIKFDDKKITIKLGDTWQTSTISNDTVKDGTQAEGEYTTTYAITYHTLIDTINIKR